MKVKTYTTCDSRVVPHRSTEQAQWCLTSEFGWDPVVSPWYERTMFTCQQLWHKLESLTSKKKCSCRGSNPGPSAHKTEALPTAPQEQDAPSGNRTRGTSLATRYFTTKPMALHWMAKRSRRDSTPQPPDSKSGALSIAPRDL